MTPMSDSELTFLLNTHDAVPLDSHTQHTHVLAQDTHKYTHTGLTHLGTHTVI